jgi:Putative peptidoglycan binding domain
MLLRSWKVLLPALAVILAASQCLYAAEGTAASSSHMHLRHKKASTAASHHLRSLPGKRATVRPTSRRKARRTAHRPSTVHTRLARMQMAPERVEQIQQALIAAGELHGAPTGRWDAETRDAMSRYQAENGFGVTGLPDAKSLMKLGLGPHPLPESLNPSRASASRLSAGDEPASSPESENPPDPPADPPSSPSPPGPQ